MTSQFAFDEIDSISISDNLSPSSYAYDVEIILLHDRANIARLELGIK